MSKIWKSQSGYSLVETVIGIAITGVLGLACSAFLGYSGQSQLRAQTLSTRDELILMLTQNLEKQEALNATANASENSAFSSCYIPSSTNGCVEQSAQTPFALYDQSGKRLTGTSADPIYYDTTGAVCPVLGQGNCLISIVTSFMATCPLFNGTAGQCQFAEYLAMTYTIAINQEDWTHQISSRGTLPFAPDTGVVYYNWWDRLQ